jgi:hypothetical protein
MNMYVTILCIMNLVYLLNNYTVNSESINFNVNLRLRNTWLRVIIFNNYYKNVKAKSVGYLLELKDYLNNNKQSIVNSYYDSIYKYYTLTDEDKEIIEFIASFLY